MLTRWAACHCYPVLVTWMRRKASPLYGNPCSQESRNRTEWTFYEAAKRNPEGSADVMC
jgi:hypothetical protein